MQKLFFNLFLSVLVISCSLNEFKKSSFSVISMGTFVKFTFYSPIENNFNIQKVLINKLKEWELIFSHYNDKSELKSLTSNYKLNHKYKLSPPLYEVISTSYKFWQLTQGLFDITINPLSRQWKMAIYEKKIPPQKILNELKKQISLKFINLFPSEKALSFSKFNLSFDLGAIAKGYILDKLAEFLYNQGFNYFIIDFGGDIIFSKPPPYKNFWLAFISLGKKNKKLKLKQAGSLVTSGHSKQFFTKGKQIYSHIINPKTGSALSNRRQISVLGNKAMIADALATSLILMKRKNINSFMKKNFPNYQYFIFDL